MSSHHPHPETFEAWVLGALAPHDAHALETHVAGCTPCAQALAREAQLELRLHHVGTAAPPAVPVAPLRHIPQPLVVLGGLAALAAAVLALVRVDPPPPPERAPQVALCQDPGSAADCVARAHFDGVVAVGPGNALEIPRYDELPAGGGR